MADALCGPSNALQGFQKHTSIDRTLQQDRLTARHLPAQGFRSISERNAGILDSEFEAFQAGAPAGIISYNDNNALIYHRRGGQLVQKNSIDGISNWASDFQSLRIEEARASPIPQLSFEQQAVLHRHPTSGWQDDFARQQNQTLVSQDTTYPYHTGSLGRSYQSGPYQWTQSTLLPSAHLETSTQGMEETFDEAAFEQAFETARVEALQSEAQAQGSVMNEDSKDMAEQIKIQHQADSGYFAYAANEQMKMENLPGQTDNRTLEQQNDSEADELARTAGQLLDNVKHDQSVKFQQSNFLSLMRQLRDKEVRVDGERIVDTQQPLHPGGPHYPEGSEVEVAGASSAGGSEFAPTNQTA